MTVAEYGLYTHLREVSSIHDYIYKFDDRKIAARFSSGSKDTFNRLRHALARMGFIVYTGPQVKDSKGHYLAQEGRILAHDEWAEQHPGACSTGLTHDTSKDSPVSSVIPAPVSPVRHKSIEPKSISADAGPGVRNTHDDNQAARPQSVAPVSPVIPADPNVRGTQPNAKLTRLADAIQGYVLLKQTMEPIEGFEHLEPVPLPEIEKVLAWAMNEPFWCKRIVGARALRTFVRNFPTIRRQMGAVQKSSSKNFVKAESVRPTGNFNYQGEIL